MLPKINLNQAKRLMKQLGIRQEEIKAEEVIIKTSDKDIIIKEPQVLKLNMMGQETFQISGKIEEVMNVNEDDLNIVVEQTNVDRDTAKKVLIKNNGDIAATIMELKSKAQ